MRAPTGLLERAVAWNSRVMQERDHVHANPRSPDALEWHQGLLRSWPIVRDEWEAFASSGGRLPRIEDVLGEHQGNFGTWRAGLLVSRGRPFGPLAAAFPTTVQVLAKVPGLRSALWSVLEPNSILPEHSGPNAGVLRYHLGVSCPPGAALRVGSETVEYRDAEAVLFDDTAPHEAWNHGAVDRVTLFCELLRPVSCRRAAVCNRAIQSALSGDSRYRDAPQRAVAWHQALNRAGPG